MKVRELVYRYHGRPVEEPVPKVLNTPAEAAKVAIELLHYEAVEVFIVLMLTQRNRLMSFHTVSRGGLDATTCHPRDVFLPAIVFRSPQLILAHNHPSGDPTPSRDDLALTRRLVSAGDLLGISVLDHIVVGGTDYCSLREQGRL